MDLLACCWWLSLVIPIVPGAALVLFYLIDRCWCHPEHYDYDLVEV